MLMFERLGVKLAPREDLLGKFARFNPGGVVEGNIVHLLYRATDRAITDIQNYVSVIGYAKLDLEGKLLHDSNASVIQPTNEFEKMGCEDPRIVLFDGTYYIFYTAYDGKCARVAIARTLDFQDFHKMGVVDHFTWDKDAFIFPERVRGGSKIAYMHRIEPSIQIDYFDSMEDLLNRNRWLHYEENLSASTVMRSEKDWEGVKIGGGAPPVKTSEGWIVIYHGVDEQRVYRAGAALLDLDDPSRVISRLPYPVFEPVEEYERVGDVPNVVFPEAVYIHDGYLYVYYGAADKYIALARIHVEALLKEFQQYRIK